MELKKTDDILTIIMCYYCHSNGFNRTALDHRSINCRDLKNDFSQIPKPQRMFNQGQRIYLSSTCEMCHTNKPNMVFSPCNHASACDTCGSTIEACPACKQSINDREKLYSL